MNNNIDNLTLFVKKDKVESIISHYKCFGWTLLSMTENERYEDLVDLNFSRPHFIKNKDELQLNQVYLEEKLNKMASNEKFKHSKSTSFLLLCIPFAVCIILLAILWLIHYQTTRSIIVGSLMITIGIFLIIINILILPKMYKKENLKFNEKQIKLTQEIEKICDYAISIGGVNDGKKL